MPLGNVTYYYPYSAHGSARAQTKLDATTVEANVEADRAFRYIYDVESVLDRLLLLFEDMDDPNSTLVSCAEYCIGKTSREAPWATLRQNVDEWANKTPDTKIPVVSWRRFSRLFRQRTRNRMFTEKGNRADEYRQVYLAEKLRSLQPGHVAVVDIAELPDYLQGFVVADVISALREARAPGTQEESETNSESGPGTVILFADELNKFAPSRGGARSLVRYLREISERGRSEGIILFGAEQFRTSVDDRVTGNSSTHVFGRTTAVEAQKDPEIRGRPQSKRVPFLRKGELLVSHTRFSSGTLKLRFPRNAYRPG